MSIIKNKKDKLAIRNKDDENKIMARRPYDLWTDFDQLFDQFRTNFDDMFWNPKTSLANMGQRTPPMDIADLGDKYEMHVEMPGIPKDDINIEVTPNGIEISAEHKKTEEDKDKNWLRQERSSVRYYRSLELPEELKTDKIDAELKDGILKISMPKVEPKPEHKPRKINIK
jgi:HSP20 family protein